MANAPGRAVLSTSFGAQSAAVLHLVTRQASDLPVVLVDTGYLFPETYRFADELTRRLGLNLHLARAEKLPAWFEARHGKLWEQGYVPIGDVHTTRPLSADVGPEATRFFGLKRECGLHEPAPAVTAG